MLDFVLMATADFSHWVDLCGRSIRRFHPEARIWLFDLSPAPSPELDRIARDLEKCEVVHYPEESWRWPAWVDTANLEFFWPNFSLRERLKMLSRSLRRNLFRRKKGGWVCSPREFVAQRKRFVRIVAQKPRVVSLALALGTADTLTFIDVDAILLARVDDALPADAQIGITVEAPSDVLIAADPGCGGREDVYPYRAVNTGVMFFRRSRSSQVFLDLWTAEMSQVRHVLSEQTALANLLYRKLPTVFVRGEGVVEFPLGDTGAGIALLPCARYNHYKIKSHQEAISPEAAIIHFVGSLKQAHHWPRVLALVEAETAKRIGAQPGRATPKNT